jgi:hypothetical protein
VFQVVSEMASAAGLTCKVDPTLVAALRSQKNGNRITVLSSIRAAQAIYVSHFILSVNELLCIRYSFNSDCILYHIYFIITTIQQQFVFLKALYRVHICSDAFCSHKMSLQSLLLTYSEMHQPGKVTVLQPWEQMEIAWCQMKYGVTFQHQFSV